MAEKLSPVAPASGSETDERVSQVLAQIIALASGNLEARGELSGAGDELDAIVGGLNMIAEELGSKINALEESESRYRLISENASDVIWTRDLNLRLRFVSPSVTRLRGISVEEALAQSLDESMTPASAVSLRLAMAEELDRDGDEDVDPLRSKTFDVELHHKDGSTVWAEVSAGFLRGPDGQPNGVLGISRDISERKRMERKTSQLQAELQQAQRLEAIGRLAGGIAHDFNNLLTAIMGYSELVRDSLRPDDPIRTDVGEILHTAERAAGLTGQLLAFSRKQVLDLKVLDLNECFTRAQSMLGRIIGEDMEIELNLAPELWPVEMDSGQIDQIVVNLVVNARDAMPDGGKLTLSSRNVILEESPDGAALDAPPGDYSCLSVTDTGTGMEPDTVRMIFEPFFSTKPKDVGTGLGLSTVFGIVKQHRGYITVDTAPGCGATIAVLLPRAEEQPGVGSATRPRRSLQLGSETVLLVEDDDKVRRLTKRMLEQLGYSVIVAESGDDAITKVARHEGEIHLLLTDVIMPGMSGRDLAEKMLVQRPGLKIAYMSGYTDNTIARLGVLEPGSYFLQKPFSYTDLTQKVRQALDE